ncbi:MAG: hypothetical protein KDC35_19900 [Acidobacteria bacterium]|nr:hypothetical protein [Acidobacteriota bacterium]
MRGVQVVLFFLWCLGPLNEGEVLVCRGSYVWNQRNGQSSELRVEFQPQGNDRYLVAFYFTFDGSPLVYSGTAVGSPRSGSMEGTVHNPGGNRTFVFKGTSRDGVFSGTHAERKRNGREYPTGSLRFKLN